MSEVNDDPVLIRRVVERQPGAEDDFVERYRGVVLGLARGRLGIHGESAEELWHDTLAKLWQDDHKALRAWRGQGRFSTYLTVIVTHLASRRRQRLARLTEESLETLPEEPTEATPRADEALMQDEAQHAVRRAMSGLSARDRLLIALRYADERTPKDIGLLVGQAPGTVRKALHDALKRLRRQLEATAEGHLNARPWRDR